MLLLDRKFEIEDSIESMQCHLDFVYQPTVFSRPE